MRSTGIVFAGALCLFAQASRDAYRNAYKEWRQADPNLERDAAAAGLQLEPRAQKAAAAATRYQAARKTFLEQLAGESARKFAWLETAAPDPPVPVTKDMQAFVAAESKAVQRNVDTFAGDPDPGIQRLRTMLQRENLALAALNNAIADREKAGIAVSAATRSLDQTRALALDEYRDVATGWKETAAQTDRESAAWVEYYKLLSDGAQGAASAPPSPVSSHPSEESVVPAKPSITPLPLIRYTGAWTFPLTNGLYHGPQPEAADLVVHEENGHADGTLFARFKLASGPGDSVVRFNFSGEFTNTRTQRFTLETTDGATGAIELIPGTAFNLLEVNFKIDAKPGKVRQGNMVLVKK